MSRVYDALKRLEQERARTGGYRAFPLPRVITVYGTREDAERAVARRIKPLITDRAPFLERVLLTAEGMIRRTRWSLRRARMRRVRLAARLDAADYRYRVEFLGKGEGDNQEPTPR